MQRKKERKKERERDTIKERKRNEEKIGRQENDPQSANKTPTKLPSPKNLSSGQSYKHFTLVNYDSRVIPDWKIPHITTLES